MRHEKHDKAVIILKDCQARGLPIESAVQFLMQKGMTYDQVLEAINDASDGALVDAVIGE
jgi:hypothetical protein